jgi:hypothetical protein
MRKKQNSITVLYTVDEKRSIGQNMLNMNESRKNLRYQSLARAKIEGISEVEILLKDLSITGCCVECTVYVDVIPNTRYKVVVMPETAAKIGDFEILVESKWIRTGGYSCEIGFVILESPKGRLFQRYVDYLAWRSRAGNAGNAAI